MSFLFYHSDNSECSGLFDLSRAARGTARKFEERQFALTKNSANCRSGACREAFTLFFQNHLSSKGKLSQCESGERILPTAITLLNP